MADRLTQLQDCLDQVSRPPSPGPQLSLTNLSQLAIQFYASLKYITTHHPTPTSFNTHASTNSATNASSNPSTNPTSEGPAEQSQSQSQPQDPDYRPDTPTTFVAATKELAHDLILKQKQIEAIIATLPDIGRSEGEQEARIRELEQELQEVEGERAGLVGMKEHLLNRVDSVIGVVKRV